MKRLAAILLAVMALTGCDSGGTSAGAPVYAHCV
jgi:hypothetical protein